MKTARQITEMLAIDLHEEQKTRDMILKQFKDSSVSELTSEIRYREQQASKAATEDQRKYSHKVADWLIELRDRKKKNEGLSGNWFSFGVFGISLPVNDDDSKSIQKSMGEGDMDPMIEIAVFDHKSDRNIFKNASRELGLQLDKAEQYLKSKLSSSDDVELFVDELKSIKKWLESGYQRSVAWDYQEQKWYRK